MATKYVDFEAAGSSHAGTDVDPFSFVDFEGDSKDGNIYKIKGSGTLSTTLSAYSDIFTMDAWNTTLYGPWRLEVTSSCIVYSGNCTIKNGVLWLKSSNFTVVGLIEDTFVYLGGTNNLYISLLYTRCTIYGDSAISGSCIGGNCNAEFVFCALYKVNVNPSPLVDSCFSYLNFTDVITNRTPRGQLANLSGSDTRLTLGASLPAAPTFTGSVSAFNIAPGYGVGAAGSWAATPPALPYFLTSPITTAFRSVPNKYIFQYSYNADATDGGPLSYSLTSGPTGMTVDATTGVLSWTPYNYGRYAVSLKVTGADGTADQNFAIKVIDPKYSVGGGGGSDIKLPGGGSASLQNVWVLDALTMLPVGFRQEWTF